MMIVARLDDLKRFYALLDTLEQKLGGARKLADCSGDKTWPRRGVYFFGESGETRLQSESGLRIVRVGTHALKAGAKATLWKRLSQHKGQQNSDKGNHRGSIFRLLVGASLLERDEHACPTWGIGNQANADIQASEKWLEHDVSHVIRVMPFLWLAVDDEAGPQSMRGYIERNAIALLSNYNKEPQLDPPSPSWLGRHSNKALVRNSELWNQNHVAEIYEPAFLDTLEQFVSARG